MGTTDTKESTFYRPHRMVKGRSKTGIIRGESVKNG
jgi:hypothetical protein